MNLKSLEISGFKSFAKKSILEFDSPISAIVGPNGSGKSNIAESFRFVLGEQSIKSMRGKRGEDLIFNGTQATGRQNRASVKVLLDNSDRQFPIDFDEVSIERIVHRDGVNEYLINNSSVRLKDVVETLSSANIGSTGHHIISQGETDRILNTTPKERRGIFEDALGLRVFQYKKTESEKKLDKTQENVKQVESLRKEIAPHIRFLKKQVEKVERTKELREKLKNFYQEYLNKEETYIKHFRRKVESDLQNPLEKLDSINQKLDHVKKQFEKGQDDKQSELDQELVNVNTALSDLNREFGQVEGEIYSLERLKRDYGNNKTEDDIKVVSFDSIKELNIHINQLIEEGIASYDTDFIKNIFQKIRNSFNTFLNTVSNKSENDNININNKKIDFDAQINELKNKKQEIEKNINNLESQKTQLLSKLKIETEQSKGSEKEIYELMTEKNILETEINRLKSKKDQLIRDEEEFKRELQEAGVLVGREAIYYDHINFDKEEFLLEDRVVQQERRRELEKMKIRVEEFGGGSGEDVMKEYEEVTERDVFLGKELEDLEISSQSLKSLIQDLEEKIDTQFKEGIVKINKEFARLFDLMFGGGEAELRLVKPIIRKKRDNDFDISGDGEDIEDDQDAQEGIDIHVSLPRKKIKGLMMLSGGERALTSIALLFAMSAVNPPPFIILDETDAALDEANSRKYGDMVDSLSEHSQVIVITHNRETMARAGVIYGVTMTQGVSQLLSIKLDDGVQYAK